MSELTPGIVAEVIAAATQGATEAAEALSRVLDAPCTLTVGESTVYDPAARPASLSGAGLLISLQVGSAAAVVCLASESGLVPEWAAAPDATGKSKLSTLAQELGMLLLPETLMAEVFEAAVVPDLAAALGRGQLPAEAPLLPLELTAGEKQGTLWLVWPAAQPAALLATASAESPAAAPVPAAEQPTAAGGVAEPLGTETTAAKEPPRGTTPESWRRPPERKPHPTVEDLHPYSKSLLRVRVPISATLASQKQPIWRIVELGPGSIIQFDKSCDELLELEVAGHKVALGEAVKVGDKFGIRISSMVLPDERFNKIQGHAETG